MRGVLVRPYAERLRVTNRLWSSLSILWWILEDISHSPYNTLPGREAAVGTDKLRRSQPKGLLVRMGARS